MGFGDISLTSSWLKLAGKELVETTIKLFKLDDDSFILNWAV